MNKMLKEVTTKTPKMWTIAIATALGAYGGFPSAPEWWSDLSKHKWFQFMTLWILILQGGGGGEYVWTTVITTIIFSVMELSKKVHLVIRQQQQKQQIQQTVQQVVQVPDQNTMQQVQQQIQQQNLIQ